METPRRKRVLLAGIHRRDRRALEVVLRGAGFELTIALDHAELNLKLLTWRPDVVLVDADAPLSDAATLAHMIRTSVPAAVPLVFVSERRPLPELHAGIVLKPVSLPDLLSVLRAALAGGEDEPADGEAAPVAR